MATKWGEVTNTHFHDGEPVPDSYSAWIERLTGAAVERSERLNTLTKLVVRFKRQSSQHPDEDALSAHEVGPFDAVSVTFESVVGWNEAGRFVVAEWDGERWIEPDGSSWTDVLLAPLEVAA